MLVDVFQLRRSGRKLSREAVESAPVLRGELSIRMSRRGYRGGEVEPHQMASLITDSDGYRKMLLPDLHNAWVKIDEGKVDFVVLGEEHVRRRGETEEQVYVQAWWCRIVV